MHTPRTRLAAGAAAALAISRTPRTERTLRTWTRHAGAATIATCLLSACGGSSSPTATSDIPADTATLTSQGWLANDTAQDLRDHWNDTTPVAEGLGLTEVPANQHAAILATIQQRFDTVDDEDAEQWRKAFEGGRVELVGARDGYVVAKATGGPAGHLHIEFDLSRAPGVSSTNRVLLERAGKLWSSRIRNPFPDEPWSEQLTIYNDDGSVKERVDVTSDGLHVIVREVSTKRSTGGLTTVLHGHGAVRDLTMPRLGQVNFGTDTRDPQRRDRVPNIFSHEIGHALGLSPRAGNPEWQGIVNFAAHEWIGPAAAAVYGGPVPLQWLDADRKAHPPGTPGTTRDEGHPGACTSIMSYCAYFDNRTGLADAGGKLIEPSELDFAFLSDMGFDIAPKSVGDAPEFYSYGVWGSWSGFAVSAERMLSSPTEDWVRARVGHDGIAPDAPLAEAGLSGTATWEGLLIGVDTSTTALAPVTGEAALEVDLATLAGQARFDSLETHVDGATSAFLHPTLAYAVNVTGNAFQDAQQRVQGAFYGPGHQEMAGTLDDASRSILAAFGGSLPATSTN